MGISRSSAIAIAWVMKNNQWDFQTSLEFVRKQRTIIKPNEGFVTQLLKFEQELKLKAPSQ